MTRLTPSQPACNFAPGTETSTAIPQREWPFCLAGNAQSTVSAICVPADKNSSDVVRHAYERYNLSLGLGLSEVAGKVFRIGHLGDLNELMILSALAGTEMALRDSGIEVVPGSGVGAASEYLRTSAR